METKYLLHKKIKTLSNIHDPDFLRQYITAQKVKFTIKDFFSKCDQIRSVPAVFVQYIYVKARHHRCLTGPLRPYHIIMEVPIIWKAVQSYGPINQSKSMDLFLYDKDLRHERVNESTIKSTSR